jgi:hypothetical protein
MFPGLHFAPRSRGVSAAANRDGGEQSVQADSQNPARPGPTGVIIEVVAAIIELAFASHGL